MAKPKAKHAEPEKVEVVKDVAPSPGAHGKIVRITRPADSFLATAETDGPHGLQVHQRVHIRGADQAPYNLESTEITSIPTPETFTFETSGYPASPATGDITVWVP